MHLTRPADDTRRQVCAGRRGSGKRRGVALLLTVFVVAISSLILLGLIETSRTQVSALQNTIDYEKAQNLAGAGVNNALAVLQRDPDFLGAIPATEFPRNSGATYSATVQRTGPNDLLITGVGTAGGITRRLEVTVKL